MEAKRHIERARLLAGQQHGLIAWRQLLALQIPTRTVKAWAASDRLVRVLPRVYSLDHSRATVERDLFAAILYAGPRAVLSHDTAAWWYGLIDHRTSDLIHVSTPRHVKPLPGLQVHGRRELARAMQRGLPIATHEQTVLDLAGCEELRLVRRALAVLDYRKLLDLDAFDQAMRHGRPGSAALRAALRIHQPRLAYANGRFEEDFLEWCERHRVPLPRVNVDVHGVLVDAYWRKDALVVELDGDPSHSSRAQRRTDKRKELILREHRITVVRYDWDLLHDEPKRVHADLISHLERSLSAGVQDSAPPQTKNAAN
jgi:hypothetical protein